MSSEADAESIKKLIIETLPPGLGEGSVIFGGGSPLDSLGLVNFLADLEAAIADRFGRDVILASDRAMSRSSSPFRDVPALTTYALELLSEQKCSA
jgi:hypothetical protein